MPVLDDEIRSLRKQIAEGEENLLLIQERKSEFVQETAIPLQLEKDERRLERRLSELRERIEMVGTERVQTRKTKGFVFDSPANGVD